MDIERRIWGAMARNRIPIWFRPAQAGPKWEGTTGTVHKPSSVQRLRPVTEGRDRVPGMMRGGNRQRNRRDGD